MKIWASPPTLDDLSDIAAAAYADIPHMLRQFTHGVIIRIDEFPDQAVLQDLGLECPFDLLGLYHGVHLGEKDGGVISTDVDKIFLYRRPILDYWIEHEEDLTALVKHVLIHEIGHHFGLSDDDMERTENEV